MEDYRFRFIEPFVKAANDFIAGFKICRIAAKADVQPFFAEFREAGIPAQR